MLPSAMSHLIRRLLDRPHPASPARPRPAQLQLSTTGQAEFVICDKSIERLVNRLKQFRRVATRYEKRAASYLAMLTLAALLLWLRVAGRHRGQAAGRA